MTEHPFRPLFVELTIEQYASAKSLPEASGWAARWDGIAYMFKILYGDNLDVNSMRRRRAYRINRSLDSTRPGARYV